MKSPRDRLGLKFGEYITREGNFFPFKAFYIPLMVFMDSLLQEKPLKGEGHYTLTISYYFLSYNDWHIN